MYIIVFVFLNKVFRCNSNEFSDTCIENTSDTFMLVKSNSNFNIDNDESLNEFLNNNQHLKWTIFNSFYYPNRDRYYNNIRSVYYNTTPYIRS